MWFNTLSNCCSPRWSEQTGRWAHYFTPGSCKSKSFTFCEFPETSVICVRWQTNLGIAKLTYKDFLSLAAQHFYCIAIIEAPTTPKPSQHKRLRTYFRLPSMFSFPYSLTSKLLLSHVDKSASRTEPTHSQHLAHRPAGTVEVCHVHLAAGATPEAYKSQRSVQAHSWELQNGP